MEIKIKGLTDTAPNGCCDHCGRADLRRYVCLELADGSLGYYGTTCGPRVLKVEQAELNRAVREFEKAEAAAKERARAARSEAEAALWFAFLAAHGTGADNATRIKSLGGFAAARAKYNASR